MASSLSLALEALKPDELRMLAKCRVAAHMAGDRPGLISPLLSRTAYGQVTSRSGVVENLTKRALIQWRNGNRLTKAGDELLDAALALAATEGVTP